MNRQFFLVTILFGVVTATMFIFIGVSSAINLGDSSIYAKEHLIVWLKPLSFWAIFVFLFIFTMLCINVIIRRQWTETEKLSYPIIQLPYEITKTGTFNSSSKANSTLLQNRIFWFGFLL